MKKTTKILSVFMAILMVFSCIPMSAIAAERDTSSLDDYLDNKNLAVIVETLLTDLDTRKEDIVPTVLKFVFMLDQLKKMADEKGVDVDTATTEQLSSTLIAYLNKVLEKEDLNGEIGAYKSIISMVINGVDIDLNSVDGILNTLVGVIDYVNKSGKKTWGDLAELDGTALKVKSGKKQVAISTKNSSCTDIIYALFGWLADNTDVLSKAVKGNLSLGGINATIKNLAKLDIEGEVNDLMGNLDVTINEMLYDNLIAEWVTVDNGDGTTKRQVAVKFADSQYAKYSSDELLAAALVKLITSKDVDQKTAAETAKMTLSQLLGKYGDYVIASFALEPLNNDLKKMLKDTIDSDAQLAVLKNIINLDYEFAVEDFNFTSLAESGIFEGLNDLVCTVIEKIVQPAVAKELALKKGGNENITANLTSFFSYVLKVLSTNNGGKLEFTIDGKLYSYDFSGFTADRLATMNLESMIVEVFRLFVPTLMGSELPKDVDTLEKLSLYSAYWAIDTYMVKPDECKFTTDFKDLVYNADGTVRDMSYSKWVDTMGTMAMQVAVYWLDRSTNFGMSQAEYAKLQADGWTWEDFLEDIVDWAIGYVKGLPAVADELDIERGKADGYGAWYKLNVVINELIPLNFVNDCGDATFVVDTYSLFINKIVPSIFDCDFAEFANVLSKNNDKESIFNKSVISAAVGVVDNLLFSLFEHSCDETATFTKAATATHDGYTGKYCKANGHYVGTITVIPATGVKDDTTTEIPTEQPTEKPTEKPTEPGTSGDVKKGDVNGDGKITASDARLALRISAKLDTPDEKTMLAADVNGDNKVTASDARKILRHSAKLEVIA